MKKLLSIAALASLGFSTTVVMPYGSLIKYSNEAQKDKGIIGGVYISYFHSPFKLELDPEVSNITYKNEYNISDWNQRDLTAVLHQYVGYNWDIRLGIHNIFVDQDGTSDKYDKVLFGGILYYQYLKYNIGLDYYYSTYDGFHVNQITTKMGFNFGNYYSETGSFYAEAKINYINISESNVAKQDNYTDVDLRLQNYQGPWMTELYASVGKNTYKVAKDGFVVYNTGGEYKYSVGMNIKYNIEKTLSFEVGGSMSKYTVDNTTTDATSTALSASFTKTF